VVRRGAFQVAGAATTDAQQLRCFGSLLPGAANASQTFLEGDGDARLMLLPVSAARVCASSRIFGSLIAWLIVSTLAEEISGLLRGAQGNQATQKKKKA
jgi:hypothetical protein